MFFLILFFFRDPRKPGDEPAPSLVQVVRNFRAGIWPPRFLIFPADLHRLLDRLLAAVHQPARLHAHLRGRQRPRRAHSHHRCRHRCLPHLRGQLFRPKDSAVPRRHSRHRHFFHVVAGLWRSGRRSPARSSRLPFSPSAKSFSSRLTTHTSRASRLPASKAPTWASHFCRLVSAHW